MTSQRANKTQSSLTCELDRRRCWLTTSASWAALAGAAYDLGLLNTVHQLTSCTDSFQNNNEKSAWRIHKHCVLAETKISPHHRPFPGARDGQSLVSWRGSLPLPTNPVWWRSMHVVSSYRDNRPTNTHTHKQTDRTNYNTLHRSFASVQCNDGVKTGQLGINGSSKA